MVQAYKQLLDEGKLGEIKSHHSKLASAQLSLNPMEHFDSFSRDELIDMVQHYMNDKDVMETLVAHRYNYTPITHTTGHDGICTEGKCYEVKNNAYTKTGFSLQLVFDRLSENNYKKFKKDLPTVILNGTHNGRIIYEITINFGPTLLKLYKNKLQETPKANIGMSFISFKKYITKINYIADDISKFKGTQPLIEYLYETTEVDHGLSYNYRRQEAFKNNLKSIKKKYKECANYAEVGRTFTSKTGFTMDGSFISLNLKF